MHLKLTSQINVVLKKFCSSQLTAGMLSGNFSETVKSFVTEDDVDQFMCNIKSTLAYWGKHDLKF